MSLSQARAGRPDGYYYHAKSVQGYIEMDINFSVDGGINLLALYAAVLSTFIAIWEVLKWRARNAVLVGCKPNMSFVPPSDDKKYIIANVTNKGDKPTTITHFIGYYWPSWTDKILKKNQKAFVVSSPDIPKVIQPGEQWMGQAHQDESMEKMAKEGFLYMGIIHSMGSKEILTRVKIDKDSDK